MIESKPDLQAPSLFVEADPAMESALFALRDSAIEPEVQAGPRVEIGVLRAWRMESDVKSWKWWLPVLAGGAMALATVLAWLQFTGSSDSDARTTAGAAAGWQSYTESGD